MLLVMPPSCNLYLLCAEGGVRDRDLGLSLDIRAEESGRVSQKVMDAESNAKCQNPKSRQTRPSESFKSVVVVSIPPCVHDTAIMPGSFFEEERQRLIDEISKVS